MNLAVSQELAFQEGESELTLSFPVEGQRVYTFAIYSADEHPAVVEYDPDGGVLYSQELDTTRPALLALATSAAGTMTVRISRADTTGISRSYILVAKEVSL